jgi:cytidine deaminase
MEEITELLIKRAKQARENAYVPYSKFKVGASVLNSDGEVYVGCNIENASYGLSNCAERTAIFKAVSNGKRDLKAIAIVADVEEGLCMPCGACRQVMAEFMDNEGVVICANTDGDYKIYTVEDMLPGAFTGKSMKAEIDEVVINKTDIPTI